MTNSNPKNKGNDIRSPGYGMIDPHKPHTDSYNQPHHAQIKKKESFCTEKSGKVFWAGKFFHQADNIFRYILKGFFPKTKGLRLIINDRLS